MKARKPFRVWAVKHEGRIGCLWASRELARADAREANRVCQGGQPWYVEAVPVLGEADVWKKEEQDADQDQ